MKRKRSSSPFLPEPEPEPPCKASLSIRGGFNSPIAIRPCTLLDGRPDSPGPHPDSPVASSSSSSGFLPAFSRMVQRQVNIIYAGQTASGHADGADMDGSGDSDVVVVESERSNETTVDASTVASREAILRQIPEEYWWGRQHWQDCCCECCVLLRRHGMSQLGGPYGY